MVCHGHSPGKFYSTFFNQPLIKLILSARIVTDMILAELHNQEWRAPKWFPLRYLTTQRRLTQSNTFA